MPDQFFHFNTRVKTGSGDITSIREQCIGLEDPVFHCSSHLNTNHISGNTGRVYDKYSTSTIDTYIFSNGATLKCTPECKFMTNRRCIKPISEFTKNDSFFTVNYRNNIPITEELKYDSSQPGYLHVSGHIRTKIPNEEMFIKVYLKQCYKNFIVALNNYTGILAFPFNPYAGWLN